MTDLGRIIAITGHYGSGKTNLAVNLAVDYAKAGERVTVIDLDIVNPYFRTRDSEDELDRAGRSLRIPTLISHRWDLIWLQL